MIHNHMADAKSSSYDFSLDSAIRGYHIYKPIWNATIGDV